MSVASIVPMPSCIKVRQHSLQAVQMEKPITLSLCSKVQMQNDDWLYQTFNPLSVQEACDFSRISSKSSTEFTPEGMNGSNSATATILRPQSAFGQAFPVNICTIPLKAEVRISSSPLLHMNVPMHPMKDISICIPPGRTMRCFHLSGSDHFICIATL